MIRERVRDHSKLLLWPEPRLVGAPSKRSFAMNRMVLEIVAKWWCPQAEAAESVPVAKIRAESRLN